MVFSLVAVMLPDALLDGYCFVGVGCPIRVKCFNFTVFGTCTRLCGQELLAFGTLFPAVALGEALIGKRVPVFSPSVAYLMRIRRLVLFFT